MLALSAAALAGLGPTPGHALAEGGDVWADSKPEDLSISLVTFGPGDQIFNYFGHNALIVRDDARRIAHLYNFGMFSFGMDMLPSYMQGKLTFWVADTPVRATFAHYIDQNRSVRVQELNLPPIKRAAMADALAHKVLPENRKYLYDHYNDNCSTRLRDLIDVALGGQFARALAEPARLNHRGHTRRYASKDPPVDFALLFWMNDQMERPLKVWDELFLPGELEKQVARVQYLDESGRQQPLVASSYTVFEARRPPVPEWPPTSWPYTLAFGVAGGALFILTALLYRRRPSRLVRALYGLEHALYGGFFGLIGTAGFLMWTLTEHTVTYRNENQLLANPLTFLLLPLGIALAFGSRRALPLARSVWYACAGLSLGLLALKVLPMFDQDVLLTASLLLPINLGGALSHRLLARSRAQARAPGLAPDRAAESRA